MKILAVIMALSCLTQTIRADTKQFVVPQVQIGGNSGPVDYGEMVILSADFDRTRMPEGLVDIKFNWTVLDEGRQKKVFVADGGREIAFAVGMRPRKIVVILDVNCLFETVEKINVVDKDGKNPIEKDIIVEAQSVSPTPILSEIIVGLGPPNPNPPSPPIPPIPVLPDGEFGLAKFMYNSFMADTNLDAESKGKLAARLADGLEGIAAKIASDPQYKDVATILADTRRVNDTTFQSLGINLTLTEPVKLVIRKRISDLYKNQKINTASDIAKAWREMGQGLRQVR